MPKNIDIAGMTFGRLTAIGASPEIDRARFWIFSCECGKITEKRKTDVISGATRSCGCLLSEATTQRLTKHGMCKTPEYRAWRAMINRCTNPKYEHFNCYGGRGITVCDAWMNSFEEFFSSVGPRPSTQHSLDRRETNGNYEPSNCRWATKQEQSNNMRKNVFIDYLGKRQTISEWSRELGIDASVLCARLKSGFSVNELLSKESRRSRFITFEGNRRTMSQWSRELGISLQTICSRVRRGLPPELALSKDKL